MEEKQEPELVQENKPMVFHNKLFAAVAKVQGELEMAKKTSENPFFKSKYADLAECLKAIYPVTSKHGIGFIQTPVPADADGFLSLNTMMCHESGQFLESKITMRPKDMTPQAVGSCISYMRRYSICAFVGLAQADDDANESQPKTTVKDAIKNKEKIKSLMDNCKSLDELVNVWETMSPEMKNGLTSYKNNLKAGFEAMEQEAL